MHTSLCLIHGEKCAYMFNVHKNQLSRQTGSRNLTGPKTLPTIWHTYMKLVTKYQISAIDSCWEKCDATTIDDTNLIFGHNLHIGTPYRGKRFLDPSDSYFLFADFVDFYTHWTYMHIFRRIFLSKYWWQESTGQKTLPTKWGTYMKLVAKYKISKRPRSIEKLKIHLALSLIPL
jgi:hypothetical protein